MDEPYLVVTVTLSMYEMTVYDGTLEDCLRVHGIDSALPLTMQEDPYTHHRTYRQVHQYQASHRK